MIRVENISKNYGNFNALKNLSFNVDKGEILCLLGANGAGKSTTINILLNFTIHQPSIQKKKNLKFTKNQLIL